jgi:hypothetical protein
MAVKYTCDRCGQVIGGPGARTVIVPGSGAMADRGELDICGNCTRSLNDWFDRKAERALEARIHASNE